MVLFTAVLAAPPAVEAARERYRSLPRTEARSQARGWLTGYLRDTAIDAWLGTPWAFYGTSRTPGKGTIACGYFVSTVLEQAAFDVERVKLAQQPSEWIVKTFAPEATIARFRNKGEAAVVDWLRTQDDGLYVAGFDYHVGMLVKRGTVIEFCHSSFVTSRAEVQCNPPLQDPGFRSTYHVVGPVLTDRVVDAWLDGGSLPTFTR